ncbi:MAG: hypothetical protein AB4040_21420 [Synechococcus sp.]
MTQPVSAASEAKVLGVTTSGTSFSVTISSPDTGCDRYADWWEVITPEGKLLYRRVLLHSHVNEQPFTRSGGPVDVAGNEPLIVRIHMHPDGYSPHAFSGSIDDGFSAIALEADFALQLADQPPLPKSCAF